jgi:hypothetical protein
MASAETNTFENRLDKRWLDQDCKFDWNAKILVLEAKNES